MMKAEDSLPPGIYVGMPAMLFLDQFGSIVWDAFGHPPYVVGSAVRTKQWRDVDVRLILPDDEYDAMFGEDYTIPQQLNGKWVALCMAFASLAKQMTGLPVDFQIQRRTQANERFSGQHRHCLGMIETRLRRGDEPT